jgi:hypothetical protein
MCCAIIGPPAPLTLWCSQSVRGAPAQLLPNQSASRPASEAVVEMEETPMVEEEADGRVGQMVGVTNDIAQLS